MALPDFNNKGELPQGLHQATMDEIVARFGSGSSQRRAVTGRLIQIYDLVKGTSQLERFIIFGSYVTDKSAPNDIDMFLVMAEEFDVDNQTGETRIIFSQMKAQNHFGASIFWVTKGTSFANLEYLISGWQTKRDKTRRGIVEVLL